MTDLSPDLDPTPAGWSPAVARTQSLPDAVARLTAGRPPSFSSAWAWIRAGVRGQAMAAAVALLLSWTGLWLVPAGAVAFVVIGFLSGFIATVVGGGSLGLLALVAIAVSAVAASLAVVLSSLQQMPTVIVGVTGGLIVSLVLFGGMVAAEPWTLHLRGYRRMSRREGERLLPLLETAALRMNITGLPRVLIAQDGTRHAYAYLRHLVVSRTLYDELDDEPLAAVLAHELHHWASADTVGLRFVFACALPLALMYNAGAWLAQSRSMLTILGWFLLWPAWLLTRLVIKPLVAHRARVGEYEADAAAKAGGYREALINALTYLGDFEGGRSGWEQVLTATHPPSELRLEALEGLESAS